MTRAVLVLLAALGLVFAALGAGAAEGPRTSANGQVDFGGFRDLSREVHAYRAGRLVSFAEFKRMAGEANTIVLDARSAEAFAQGHIDGAINLSLSDFTAPVLVAALGDKRTRILIYCNNNFENNVAPVVLKRVELALNIQTFINLYGYGYRNVYELGDTVNFDDPAVGWVKG